MNSTLVVPVNRSGWRPVAHAASQDAVVPQNGRRRIELLEEFTIPDGESELLLPIEVTPKRLSIDGDAPPRVVRVSTAAEDVEHGAGHELNITVLYTSKVEWRPSGVAEGNRCDIKSVPPFQDPTTNWHLSFYPVATFETLGGLGAP